MYTVADLARQVARDRVAWVGPTLRVRGMIVALPRWVARSPDVGGTEVILTRPRLVDQGGVVDFPLVTGLPDPLLVDARRIPLIGRLLPPAQSLQRGPSAIYRIQLRALGTPACACYEAVLLDTAPDLSNTSTTRP